MEDVMPAYRWPSNTTQVVSDFETRHGNPEAGALLLFGVWSVDSLYYLDDLDQALDPSQAMVGEHSADVVDVAHARWAATTCITALDLCAAGLGRALCGHRNKRELALGDFDVKRDLERKQDRAARLRASLPQQARQWIDNVLTDPDYGQIKGVRNSLTHARVARHLTAPRQRIRLQVGDEQLDVPTIIDCAKRVGSKHVSQLLAMLPDL
jgi:hypothetical protein